MTSLAYAAAVAMLVVERRGGWCSRLVEFVGPPLVVSAAALASYAIAGDALAAAVVAGGLLGAVASTGFRSRNFHATGLLLLLAYAAMMTILVPWSAWFLANLRVSDVTKGLILCAYPLLLCFVPVNLVRAYENWEVLCRRGWSRPREPLPGLDGSYAPCVSIHVPAHAEPPKLVVETLDRLAGLDYPNFEVLLIDNNTDDPELWRPVERHCRALGPRFRFFHVEGVTGAKAGALNYALRQADPNAELIAVVDADYQVEPDFLSGTVGYFAAAKMGFVQGPHAYRGYEGNAYLATCNWEYAYYFGAALVSLNERNAAITVGTMSVIRRRALEDAGGWAEWCLTEDSELAVRIQALGYDSVYTTHVFGRGLIPPTFAGYRRQRFRWSYGPVQEFRRHARLLLPGPWRQPSGLTRVQRVHHATHGLHNISLAMELLATPLAVAVLASMAIHRESVPLPLPLWIAWTTILLGEHGLRFLTYRALLGGRVRDGVRAFVASSALMLTIRVASFLAAIGWTAKWRRTDKFPAQSRGIAVLKPVWPEVSLSISYLTLAAAAIVVLRHSSFAIALAIGIAMQGLVYLAAPAMALLADRDLRRLHDSDTPGADVSAAMATELAVADVGSAG